jgi:tetratricopeptide (TPR) repeat protein
VLLAIVATAAGLGAAAALGVAALVHNAAKTQVTTVVRTEQVLPKPTPVALDKLVLESRDGRTLNDAAFYLIQAREYARAIPLARKALRYTKPGSLTRGYATFNLGFALLKVGRCAEALPLLERALKIEASDARKFIRPRIRQAQACRQGGASGRAPSRSSGATANPSPGQ